MGIDERLVAGSEESQDRVEEEQTDDAQSDTDDEIQRNRVTQNVLRCGIVFCPNFTLMAVDAPTPTPAPKAAVRFMKGKVMARPEIAMAPTP